LISLKDLYYLPFYFQSAQGVTATVSGVRAIPLGLSQIVAVIIVGALATKTGYYVRMTFYSLLLFADVHLRGMQWINVKKIAEKEKGKAQGSEGPE